MQRLTRTECMTHNIIMKNNKINSINQIKFNEVLNSIAREEGVSVDIVRDNIDKSILDAYNSGNSQIRTVRTDGG